MLELDWIAAYRPRPPPPGTLAGWLDATRVSLAWPLTCRPSPAA